MDEAARREEKELKRSREAAKKELQKDIVRVQDEADLCLRQAHQLEVRDQVSYRDFIGPGSFFP